MGKISAAVATAAILVGLGACGTETHPDVAVEAGASTPSETTELQTVPPFELVDLPDGWRLDPGGGDIGQRHGEVISRSFAVFPPTGSPIRDHVGYMFCVAVGSYRGECPAPSSEVFEERTVKGGMTLVITSGQSKPSLNEAADRRAFKAVRLRFDGGSKLW